MKRLHKRLLWAAAALVVLGLLAYPKLRGSGAEVGNSPPPNRVAGALPVTGYVVSEMPLEDRIRATGTLRADESVDLASEVSGRVTRIYFREGSRVSRGQLLVKINDDELQAQRQRLQYRIDLARTREQRQRRLLEIGGVSQEEYDTALGEVNVLRADLAHVEAQIARTEVRAPFAGVIGLRHVSEGAFVSPQSRLASLQALSPMKLDFSVPERYVGQIRLGDVVTFSVAGSPRSFRGEVFAVEPRVDEETRTLLIRAAVANPDGILVPGAFANVELTVADVADALLVPAIAIIPELEGRRVWVSENGEAVSRRVETGLRTDAAVQITGGLSVGDTVLVSGLQLVRPGQRVRFTEMTYIGPASAIPALDTVAPQSTAP